MIGFAGTTRSNSLWAWTMAGLLAAASAGALAQGQGIGKPNFPDLRFPDRAYGEEAINRLGDRLPEVAAWYGLSPSEFVSMLRKDSTAWIDMRA